MLLTICFNGSKRKIKKFCITIFTLYFIYYLRQILDSNVLFFCCFAWNHNTEFLETFFRTFGMLHKWIVWTKVSLIVNLNISFLNTLSKISFFLKLLRSDKMLKANEPENLNSPSCNVNNDLNYWECICENDCPSEYIELKPNKFYF